MTRLRAVSYALAGLPLVACGPQHGYAALHDQPIMCTEPKPERLWRCRKYGPTPVRPGVMSG